MNEKTKESRFLDAINQYTEQMKAQMTAEIEEYTAQKIEQATDNGLKDAYELIRNDAAVRKAALKKDAAQKEYAMRSTLFKERERIRDEVFERAAKKLSEYTMTEAYQKKLILSAEAAAAMTDGEACVVFLREADMQAADEIVRAVPNAAVQADPQIRIGGLRVYCAEKHIVYDDTLDQKLEEQKRWFTERSGLKVV